MPPKGDKSGARAGSQQRLLLASPPLLLLYTGEPLCSDCLILAIALPGFRPLGHVCAQFMIVLQRYSLYASSSAASRSAVKSSRESMIQRYLFEFECV